MVTKILKGINLEKNVMMKNKCYRDILSNVVKNIVRGYLNSNQRCVQLNTF